MARGLSFGVLILSFFSWFWLTGGMELLKIAHAGMWTSGVSLLCGLLAACGVYGIVSNRRAEGGMTQRDKRNFNLINAAQWVAIVAAIAILNRVHRPEMIPWVVSIIVGLHFFPLARVFRRREHFVVGGAILGVDLPAFLLAPSIRYGVAMLGTGVVLVICASRMSLELFRVMGRQKQTTTAV